MLPILATAYERKGDKAEAIRALGEYIGRAPNAPDRVVIEHRIRNLKDQLAREQPPPALPPTASATGLAQTPPPAATTTPTAVPSPPAPTQPLGASEAPPDGSQSPHPWVFVGCVGASVACGVIILLRSSDAISIS